MIFAILFMTVQFCTAQIHPEQWTIPIVSDEHGILCFGNPFEQNETAQPMVELPLSADFYQEVEAGLSPSQVSQSRAIKTLLTVQETKTLSADLSQPLHTFICKGGPHQNVANPEAHQQEIPSTLFQETVLMDINMTDADLATFLAYGDLGPLSADDISIEALSPDTDMESLLNDTCQFGNASVRDAKHQPNTSDFLKHQQTPATFSDFSNKRVQNADKKQDRNMVPPTFSGPVCGQSCRNIPANFRQNVVQPDNFDHRFVNHDVGKPCPLMLVRSSSASLAITEDIKTIHSGEKRFKCDTCLKQFRTSSDYKKHQRMHTGERPFQCSICQKQFSDRSNYRTHLRIHTGEKPFQCDICLKQFLTSGNYQTHRRTHTGEKPFQCDMCPKRFVNHADCKTHRRTHTEEKPFQCDICPKQFGSSSSYRRHRRTHTGEKPFQCDICLKQFITSSNYQTHLRTHSGEKPFQCDMCPKRFVRCADCKKHRRTHTGEKPFQCDICSKRFGASSSYRRHRQTHKYFMCYWCNQNYSSERSLVEHIKECSSRNSSYAAGPVMSFFISNDNRRK